MLSSHSDRLQQGSPHHRRNYNCCCRTTIAATTLASMALFPKAQQGRRGGGGRVAASSPPVARVTTPRPRKQVRGERRAETDNYCCTCTAVGRVAVDMKRGLPNLAEFELARFLAFEKTNVGRSDLMPRGWLVAVEWVRELQPSHVNFSHHPQRATLGRGKTIAHHP